MAARAPVFAVLLLAAPLTFARAQDSTRATRTDSTRARTTRLEAVTIVATPAERAEPVSATHVDAATIAVTPSNSPYDLLRQTAGVEVHLQGQGPGFASDASLRGFSSDHSTDLALWVDGVPINEPVNGHAEGYNDWAVLFPGGVQDIDVIHGPTSALFGNFALAGVVNVRTIERMTGTQVTAAVGSYGHADAMVLTGFDHAANGGGVLGLHYQRDDGFRPNSRNDVLQGHARLVRNLSSNVTLDGGAELYGGNWNSPGFLSEDEFAARQYDVVSNPTDGGFKRRAQERASLRVLTGNMIWRTTAYATQGRWQLFLTIPPAGGRFEGSGSQTEEEDTRAGLGATSALTWALSRGEITMGGETRWDRSHYENYFTTSRVRDSVAEQVKAWQALGAPFVQSYTNLTSRLRVDVGARYDVFDTHAAPEGEETARATHSVFSPKLGALYRVTPAVGLYANASRGFRSPDGIIEDPTLVPITVAAYEAGLKLDRGQLSASADLFRMNVSNEQTFNPVTLASTSGGASQRQGVELAWRIPVVPALATLSGALTINDARYKTLNLEPEDGGDPERLDGLRVYNTSRYVGNAALDVSPAGTPWHIRASGELVAGYSPFDEPGVVLGGYTLAHLSGAWTFRVAEVDLGIRNLFNRAYPELVADHIVSPGEPRTVYLTVRTK
jgi:outer membrane receptor protein involved in Fe transport